MTVTHGPNRVWFDGEKIPDAHIRDVFRWPPGCPQDFDRSALIVGARGAGKTTLFRYLKNTHEGVAIHINLAAEFSSLGKQASLGPLSTGAPNYLDAQIAGKAISLLAVTLSERLLKKGLKPPVELVAQCLPRATPRRSRLSQAWCQNARRDLAVMDLREFDGVSDHRPLLALAAALGEKSIDRQRPLLLLFDRGDMVPPAALAPAIELLDQSILYISLLAIRPGHAGDASPSSGLEAVPGDHYPVVHLGAAPYTEEWIAFVAEAIRVQLGPLPFSLLSKDTLNRLLTLSRDSLRTGLELVRRCSASTDPEKEIVFALEDIKENHLVAAQRVLRRHHPDFRRLIREARQEVIRIRHEISGPVTLEIQPSQRRTLWEDDLQLNSFVDSGLRAAAFSMPSGQKWVPGLRVRELEIPPMLVWEKSDSPWTYESGEGFTLRRSTTEILKSGGGGASPPQVFVAFRWDFAESQVFRDRVEAALKSHGLVKAIEVVDGRVHPGVVWPPEIRRRIEKSRVVIADVTGSRHDVIFEMGFGAGLRKPLIPVVSESSRRKGLPEWLRVMQIGSYDSDRGILAIVSSVLAHLPKAASPTFPVRDGVPGLAIWVGQGEGHLYGQFTLLCEQEGLAYENITEFSASGRVIEKATRGGLLVLELDGTIGDSLLHFLAGAAIAKPTGGYGAQSLRRRILLLGKDGRDPKVLAAPSLWRCEEIVDIGNEASLIAETREYGKRHRHWAKSAAGG